MKLGRMITENELSKSGDAMTGLVLTNDQVIIPNANVKNITTGFEVQSNADGYFEIPFNSSEDEIRFSHIGFDYDTVKVKDYNGSYYELYPATEWLDEIVITGNSKPKNNALLWVLGGLLVAIVGFNVLKPKPTRVKV